MNKLIKLDYDLIQNALDYTGVTRAKQSIIFAKKKRKFYAFY